MSHVSDSELRADMARHLDRVVADRSELVVTRQDRGAVVILPLAELASLRETLHLLSTRANADHLLRSVAELDRGEGHERALTDA